MTWRCRSCLERARTPVNTPCPSANLDGRRPMTSPDGRWLAYEAESPSIAGQLDIYVRSFPDVNRGLWQVTRDGGTFPVWSRNGRELFYARLDGTIVALAVETSATTWKAGSPKELFRGPYFMRDGSLGESTTSPPTAGFSCSDVRPPARRHTWSSSRTGWPSSLAACRSPTVSQRDCGGPLYSQNPRHQNVHRWQQHIAPSRSVGRRLFLAGCGTGSDRYWLRGTISLY